MSQNFPPANFWEYCCDCDRFYPFQLANNDRRERNLDVEQCVNCKRHAIKRYLCDQCNVVSIESREKGEKSYRITATGSVRLAKGPIRHECPACMKSSQAAIGEHHCKKVEVTYTTARDECPFCGIEIQQQISAGVEQVQTNGQAFTIQRTLQQSQIETNDSDMPFLASQPVDAAQIPPSAAYRARQFGINLIGFARKHAKATATFFSALLAIVALLLTPPIRGRFLNHAPRVENIIVNMPVTGRNVSLIGMAFDPDDDPLTYQWSCSTGTVIEWNNQYAQLQLPEPSASAKGTPISVHLRVLDPDGASAKLDKDIAAQPPPPNQQPSLTLLSDKQVAAVGEKVMLTAEAEDKDGDPLSYKWSCPNKDAFLSGEGVKVVLDTAKIQVSYAKPVLVTVYLAVNDGHGNSALDKMPILVVSNRTNKMNIARPSSKSTNHLFTLSLSPVEKSWVYPGERLKLVAKAVATHRDDTLTYQWEASNGCVIEGVGSDVWLNTATLNPQVDLVVVQVNLVVKDQHGSSIRGSIKIFVIPKPTSTQPTPESPSAPQ